MDKTHLTQFGRAMAQLGIDMIPSYSPQARGRSERLFGTLQGRLPQELALAGITEMAAANRFLKEYFWPRFNERFTVPAPEPGVLLCRCWGSISRRFCVHEPRTVRSDNCVAWRGMTLQIPAHRHRCHFVKVKVSVHEYADGTLSIFHGPRCLARYDAQGVLLEEAIAEKNSAQRGKKKAA